MPTELRILRAEARDLDPTQKFPTTREQQRHERILSISRTLIARHGIHEITFRNLADALSMAPATLRRHFPDLHALLAELIRIHLLALSAELGTIPWNTPNRPALLRKAYLAFTRTALGGLTEAHLLLTRDARRLPPDEREPIELTHANLGHILAPEAPLEVLVLLDTAYLPAERIEIMLAPLLTPPETAKPQPKRPSPRHEIGAQPPRPATHQPPPARRHPAAPAETARAPPPH